MGVLADWQIKNARIIEPFVDAPKTEGVISSGVSSYGYDLRSGSTFEVFSAVRASGGVVDPKNFKAEFLERVGGDDPKFPGYCTIPPNSFALTYSLEHLSVPRYVLAIVLGKSTYARCGVIVNCTPLEPEWRGHVTLEISNTTPLPARIYANEGVAQVLFLRADGRTEALVKLIEEFAGRDETRTMSDLLHGGFDLRAWEKLCRRSYADKKGRYQDQSARVTLPCATGATPGAAFK